MSKGPVELRWMYVVETGGKRSKPVSRSISLDPMGKFGL